MNRSNNIMKRVKEHYEEAQSLGHEVLVCALQGSQNYGLDYEGSDIDTKCIVLPTLEDLIFDMTILIRDKENDFEGFSRVFTAKPAQHKKGEEFSMVCGSWIDRVLI